MEKPDEITLQKAKLNGLIQARDSISHEIAVEQKKLDEELQRKRQLESDS